jgi:sec-independent protein translocase protein TatC
VASQIKPPDTQNQLPPGTEPPEEEEKVMTFFEHIDELRGRVLRALIAVGLGMCVSVLFTNNVIQYLSASYGQKLALLEPTDSVVTFFRVALTLGAILAMPVITYQLFMFVLPGLTRKEKRWVFLTLPGTTALFMIGLLFTWFYLVPVYVGFLSSFQSNVFFTNWTADSYITFVMAVLFWHGAAFEAPLVFYVLARMGMVTARSMLHYWRHAIVVAAILSAFITPTVDPITMTVVVVVLIGLYALSIVLVFFATRLNRRRLGPA